MKLYQFKDGTFKVMDDGKEIPFDMESVKDGIIKNNKDRIDLLVHKTYQFDSNIVPWKKGYLAAKEEDKVFTLEQAKGFGEWLLICNITNSLLRIDELFNYWMNETIPPTIYEISGSIVDGIFYVTEI